MARTVEQIIAVMDASIAANPALASINNTSKASIFYLIKWVVAACIWTLEVLFDEHKAEVDDKLTRLKPHKFSWYREKALAFRYGYPLIAETDSYDDTGLSEDDIEQSKLVKYAAVEDVKNEESRLIIKVAGENGGVLGPISQAVYDAFTEYISRVKDAGVRITILNLQPDRLYLTLKIFYDPLILDEYGNNILTGGKPVEDAIIQFLKDHNEQSFNGELVLVKLIDKLQKVEGVAIPHLVSVASSNYDVQSAAYTPPVSFSVKKKPEAGYFEIANFAGIEYTANV